MFPRGGIAGSGGERCTVDNQEYFRISLCLQSPFSAFVFLPISIIGFGFICMHMT